MVKKHILDKKGGSTYIDYHSVNKRFNYLKRHDVNEDWDDPYKAGTLSAYLLWGNNKTLKENIRDFNKVFF